MKPILQIQNVSKKYRLRGQETPYLTLRDAIMGKNKKESSDTFWALKDISFDVYPGDTIGIIGKNGAGKSTLLKILSRITPPTTGKIISRGRIASLLEVGTGFHGELTGRENIYLNGSILGLKKTEINKKFDEIVDFSGVEKFLDTPLKHYSSGMQLRLAFAVAAHLEPEILIIDEVLAVGDAEFQKKCMGKMEDISKGEGRTILFVSHNMGAVKQLCSKGLFICGGMCNFQGNIQSVIESYTSYILGASLSLNEKGTIFKNTYSLSEGYDLLEIRLKNNNGEYINSIQCCSDFTVEFVFFSSLETDKLSVAFFLKSLSGETLLRFATKPDKNFDIIIQKGLNSLICNVKKCPITSGIYTLSFGIAVPNRNWVFFKNDICTLEITNEEAHQSDFVNSNKYSVAVADYSWLNK